MFVLFGTSRGALVLGFSAGLLFAALLLCAMELLSAADEFVSPAS